jgi:hypothetical protein
MCRTLLIVGFSLTWLMAAAGDVSAQTFTEGASGGRSGDTRSGGGPGFRPTVPRNIRVADDRGRAGEAVGSTGELSPPPIGAAAPRALPQGETRSAGPAAPIPVAQGEPTLGRISKGTGTLPNDGGQVWREYDLTPYTSKIAGDKPEQAVIDWVLRETGTDVWFSTPLGILSADRDTLRVYHTPEIQEAVKGIYDRFMSTSAEPTRLQVRVITVNNPNWRSRVLTLLKPVEVQAQGVDAWLLTREHATLLMADLRQRMDYKEHAATVADVPNGQTFPLGLTRQKQYVRSIKPRPDVYPGFEPEVATLDEGYSLTLSALEAVDGKSLDVVVKCHIDQVEKLIDIPLDVPTPLGSPQRMSIQVPQLVSWRLHERFRWPSDHVLLLSCGVVATPTNEREGRSVLGGLLASNRADALLVIEPVTGIAGAAAPLPGVLPVALPPPPNQPGSLPFTASPLMPPSKMGRMR